jgi:hypothetical protein
MLQLVNDLYKLSDNSALFEQLRTGCDLTTLTDRVADFAGVPARTDIAGRLQAFRDAIVPALQADDRSRLDKLIEAADINDRVIICGELILTVHALTEGKHAPEKVDAVLKSTFHLARDLAGAMESVQPQDTGDERLMAHAIALREWAHLLAEYYQAAGRAGPRAEMLLIRARVTNCTLSSWPHLVGQAMIEVALALEPVGHMEMALNCCKGVRMDLHYLVDRIDDPAFPEFEKVVALYWLQRACEEFFRLAPGDADAASELQRVRTLRTERGHADAVSAPRFGPIARTYLAPTPYLALILRDLLENGGNVPDICQRYGCLSTNVDFYLSAMGSYEIRDTVLRGVQSFYDEAHQEVFAAMDHLRRPDQRGTP